MVVVVAVCRLARALCVPQRGQPRREGFTHYDHGQKGGGADGGREHATFSVERWV